MPYLLSSNTGWRRARASIPFNDCVEVRADRQRVRVRDSKEKPGAELRFYPTSWAAFVRRLGHGR
ncbi:DUF397 domain-containing protein [Actinophytocola xanthii]|uniref:DUF397 domain-containing protein n=1 Tax=Actinophytocola xanthii TaxID=1912961 RepID=A0A1Q8CLD4_9PSEU|nr:DUF397 domain-containing protein [Actinophytocola xanthii]OLF15172.1 hypothetical protein BU204_23190 [Actinophytocola xanthii]